MKNGITLKKILKTILTGDRESLMYVNYSELESNIKKLVYKNGLDEVYVVCDREQKVFYGLCSNLIWTFEDVKLDSNVEVRNLNMSDYDKEMQKNLLKSFELFKTNHPDFYGNSFDLDKMNEMIQKDLKIATIVEREKVEELCALESVYHDRFSKNYEYAANLFSQNGQLDIPKDSEYYAFLGMNLAILKRNLPQKQVCCYCSEEEKCIYLTDQTQIEELGVEKIPFDYQANHKYVICSYLDDAIKPIDHLIYKDSKGINHVNEDDIYYFYSQVENFRFNHPEIIEKHGNQKKK